MDVNTIWQGISSVGFPIVICIILLFYIKELNRSHAEEVDKFTDALNKNTLVLQKLCDKMDVDREER